MEDNKSYLHITNGECFNEYFEKQYGEKGVPFNEAMMYGLVKENLFDEEFCKLRAKELNVTKEEYYKKLELFFSSMKKIKNYNKIVLWFGDDCFCQINMLSVLSYLEKLHYTGKVYSMIIDDRTYYSKRAVKEIRLCNYSEILKSVLILKKYKRVRGNFIMSKSLKLYLDYNNPSGKLSRIISKHKNMNQKELVSLLLRKSQKYGITDFMAEQLIKKNNTL